MDHECMARPAYLRTLDWLEERPNQEGPGLEKPEEIRVPVLIAFGTMDLLLGAQQGSRFVESPNARLKSLPGCGHIPMSDDPELVVRTVLEFIDEHSKAT